MTTACDRCGTAAAHLFPGSKPPGRVCSSCYEALRLHRQGTLLAKAGLVAMVLGAALLVSVVLVLVVSAGR